MSKVIVITGAGQGLGRALAIRLAADGHNIALLGRTLSKVEKVAGEIGGNAFAVECDLGSPDSVRAAFAQIAERHPTIDVLINNAALYDQFFLADATDEQIETAMSSNLTGAIYATRAAIPVIPAGGRIINVTSESVTMNHAMLSLYQSTKAGLDRLTEAMRLELRSKGIRMTLVRASQMMADDADYSKMNPEIARIFMTESARQGVHMRERGITHVKLVAEMFVDIINADATMNVAELTLESWAP